jgi:addiction module RelE/StbE family toxin
VSLKTFQIRITEPAARDLDLIFDFISAENPNAAEQVLNRLTKAIQSLRRSPRRGRQIPELLDLNWSSQRELVVPPYRVLYRIGEKVIWILAIFDSRRQLEDLIFSRVLANPEDSDG